MTPGEEDRVIAVVYEVERRLSQRQAEDNTLIREKIAKLEGKVEGQIELKRRVGRLETKQDTDNEIMRDRSNRLLLGLVVVALLAGIDLAARIGPALI